MAAVPLLMPRSFSRNMPVMIAAISTLSCHFCLYLYLEKLWLFMVIELLGYLRTEQ